MATDEFCGPLDYLVFAFPSGADADSGLTEVLARVDAGLIEVLDIEIVAIDEAGVPASIPLEDAARDFGLSLESWDGAPTNILEADDRELIAQEIPAGGFAIAILYEERTLAAAAAAWIRAGGREALAGGVDVEMLEQSLEGND